MSSATDQTGAAVERRERQPRERVIGSGIEWMARWSLRWVAIALGLVLLGLVVQQTWSIVLPIILALVITSVLAPVSRILHDRLGLPSGLAAAGALLGSLLVIVGVGFAIAPSVAGQSDEIVANTTAGLQRLQDSVQGSDFVSKGQIDAGLQGLQDRVQDSAGGIASGVLVGVSAVGSATVTLVISLILTFLFLKDGRRFVPWMRRIAGPQVGPHLAEVASRSWRTLGGFIRTQALVSLIDAVFIGAALLIVGVPLAVPLALLTFFGGFVPIVGAFVVGAVAVLVALVSNGASGALIILGVIVAVQQLEGNVLSPWLQSQSMNLHAAVVLLSVTLGSTLFGITGAFLAVPTAAVSAVVLRYLFDIVDTRSIDRGASAVDADELGPAGDTSREAGEGAAPASRTPRQGGNRRD
jgi:predicted PurR-regulated permease PerM